MIAPPKRCAEKKETEKLTNTNRIRSLLSTHDKTCNPHPNLAAVGKFCTDLLPQGFILIYEHEVHDILKAVRLEQLHSAAGPVVPGATPGQRRKDRLLTVRRLRQNKVRHLPMVLARKPSVTSSTR